ncbi:MAG TPA: 50S ribosomal protein L11 methyltransferase [Burkholderiaceae bacterium]|nr:50S ribosomal protein L11 methyltransferase [Burkholderiaceae bacterium]
MRELVLMCPEPDAEALSDALIAAGALSVSVEDADTDTPHEIPLYGEPGLEPPIAAWRNNRVVALLPGSEDPVTVLETVRDMGGGNYLASKWTVHEVPDQDWVGLTQGQFGPLQIGERIWVVPSWHRDDPDLSSALVTSRRDASDIVRIELDPGLAFGTGSHPTTHLCLEWLSDHLNAGQTVLDYGCGSGILAIAAKKLGAGRTWATDIDIQAVEATRANALNNHADISAMLPADLPEGQSDIVVANILSSPLKVMASMLSGRVAPGGHLVLSGILDWQAQELIDAYAPWLTLEVWKTREVWVCLHGRARA